MWQWERKNFIVRYIDRGRAKAWKKIENLFITQVEYMGLALLVAQCDRKKGRGRDRHCEFRS